MAPPRSVADATRFTPTGPHAFTRPPMAAAAASGNPETPQQRVARLREAARKSKQAQISVVDRIIDRSRAWADRAHRTVALGLIGATVLCGGFTIFVTLDMIFYARRKRRAYLAEQRALREAETESASAPANPESNVLANAPSLLTRPQGPRTTMTEKLKAWALSGLTPAEKEEEIRQMENTEPDVVPKDDMLVKGEKAKGGAAGTFSSITEWWSGR